MLMFLYHLWRERFTLSGKVFGGTLLLCSSIEIFPGRSNTTILLVFISAALVLAFIVTLRFKYKVEVQRHIPVRVRAGSSFNYKAVLVSKEKKDIYDVGVQDFRLHESIKLEKGDTYIGVLKPGVPSSLEQTYTASARGVWLFRGPTLLRADALGLMRARWFLDHPRELLVHPKFKELRSFDFLFAGNTGQAMLRVLASYAGEEEFAGLREYQAGDRQRDIHHRSFARKGKPITKLYSKEIGEGLALQLDPHLPNWMHRYMFEDLISLTAAVASWLYKKNLLSGFRIGQEVILPENHKYSNALQIVLDGLARAVPSVKPYERTHISRPLLILGAGLDPLRIKAQAESAAAGDYQKLIQLLPGKGLEQKLSGEGDRVKTVTMAEIRQGRVRL
jgi:uncharacterized protein (DUF58 family)